MATPRYENFIARHLLPDSFRQLISEHYAPLAAWLAQRCRRGATSLCGIAGAQGTGKSTLADFIRVALTAETRRRVAVLSLDDFYLTRAARRRLGRDVHPLLLTRGVPGTHDIALLSDCLSRLRGLPEGRTMRLPRFDKALDERANAAAWPVATGPVDLIILEGWCVGSPPQDPAALATPINELERRSDAGGEWRRYVNRQLADPYAKLFAQLDTLIFLRAPNFAAVRRWRLEQEEKLATAAPGKGSAVMDADQVSEFIRYFERITRYNLEVLPSIADAVFELGEDHGIVRGDYRQADESSAPPGA